MTIEQLNPKRYELKGEVKANLLDLAERLTVLEEAYGVPFLVTSGLRSVLDQERINPRNKHSAHLLGQAADVSDPDKLIWGWVIDNLEFVATLGLYMEEKSFTKSWVHFQTRAPKSKNRIFIP